MKRVIKTSIGQPRKHSGSSFILIAIFAFGFFALLPLAQAVVPAPDGGYPGFNTAEGTNALKNLTTGVGNAAVGWYSLFSNTDGSYNTGVGTGTLLFNTAFNNTAFGTAALLFNTTGFANTAIGSTALQNNNGNDNTAVGFQALASSTSGGRNTVLGWAVLANSDTAGNENTLVGAGAGGLAQSFGNANVYIGADVVGSIGESSTTRIRNVGSTAIVGGVNVVVESTGGNGNQRLGYASSSRRYKQEIKPMDKASETLFALKPVTFRAKKNTGPAGGKYYGLIAEDVAKVDSDLVVYNSEGQPETLRFDSINAMLLNEFLKEHRKVEEQQVAITELKKEMESLVAHLKEHDSKIQRVSAQLEITKTAPQMARNTK